MLLEPVLCFSKFKLRDYQVFKDKVAFSIRIGIVQGSLSWLTSIQVDIDIQ